VKYSIAVISSAESDERYKSVVATLTSTKITPPFNILVSKKILSSCSALMVDVARQCYHIYLETYGLGIDASGRLPPFQFYLHATSVYPFEQICGPSNALMSCINTRVPSACVNIAMFRVLTYSDDDAYNYLGTYAAFEYICGKGYTEFVSNQQCFIRASSDPAIGKQLQSCGITVDSTDPIAVCK
uniref:Gnk2-homologous domain-containing protein n=1 Tax=Ascaris lumbricoides TaxID=6252 RepID=A0A0M3HFV1_ASCLU